MLAATCNFTPDIFPFVHSSYSSPHIFIGVTDSSFWSRVCSRVTLWGLCYFVSPSYCSNVLLLVPVTWFVYLLSRWCHDWRLLYWYPTWFDSGEGGKRHWSHSPDPFQVWNDYLEQCDPWHHSDVSFWSGYQMCAFDTRVIPLFWRGWARRLGFGSSWRIDLVSHSYANPKFHYLLCTAPCYQLEVLVEYDNTLHVVHHGWGAWSAQQCMVSDDIV